MNVAAPDLDKLLDDGVTLCKNLAENMLKAKKIASFVVVFVRHNDTGEVGPIVVPVDNSDNDTPSKRKQHLIDTGRLFVRQVRAGVGAWHANAKTTANVPEVDLKQLLLVMHAQEAWYLADGDDPGKTPTKSSKRKEAVLIDSIAMDARHTIFFADILRKKNGAALPLVFGDKEEVTSQDSTAALFLVGMKEEMRAGRKFN